MVTLQSISGDTKLCAACLISLAAWKTSLSVPLNIIHVSTRPSFPNTRQRTGAMSVALWDDEPILLFVFRHCGSQELLHLYPGSTRIHRMDLKTSVGLFIPPLTNFRFVVYFKNTPYFSLPPDKRLNSKEERRRADPAYAIMENRAPERNSEVGQSKTL